MLRNYMRDYMGGIYTLNMLSQLSFLGLPSEKLNTLSLDSLLMSNPQFYLVSKVIFSYYKKKPKWSKLF